MRGFGAVANQQKWFYRFYFGTTSQPARSIKALLLQAGARVTNCPPDSNYFKFNPSESPIEVEEHHVEIFHAEHKTREYKSQVSRDGVVPYLIQFE